MAYGDSYWGSGYGSNPDFMFPSNTARRKYEFGLSNYDQSDQQARSDRDYAQSQLDYEYPRKIENMHDQQGGRGLYFSGITTNREGDLARQQALQSGALERALARHLSNTQQGRIGLGIDYESAMEAAGNAATSGQVNSQFDWLR